VPHGLQEAAGRNPLNNPFGQEVTRHINALQLQDMKVARIAWGCLSVKATKVVPGRDPRCDGERARGTRSLSTVSCLAAGASMRDFARILPATRGLIAVPWTPASLSLLPQRSPSKTLTTARLPLLRHAKKTICGA
jgi:hypothetical protein